MPRARSWRAMVGQHVGVDEDKRQWPPALMALGVFATIVTFWWISFTVLVSYWTVARILCAFGFAGNLFYGDWIRERTGFSRSYWFMFNMLAVGPWLFCAFFALNGLFPRSEDFYAWGRASDLEHIKRQWIETDSLPPGLTGPGVDVSGVVLVRAWDTAPGFVKVSRGAFGIPVLVGFHDQEHVPGAR